MKKSTLMVLAVFGLLVALLVVRSGEEQERGVSRVSMRDLNMASVDKLVIKDGDTTVLVKQSGEWALEGGRRAEKSSVQAALDNIQKIESTKLLTRKPERYAELKVDDATGVAVTLFSAGQELAAFVIGGGSAGASSVRVGSEVFSVPGVYAGTFKRKGTGWVDRTIIELKPADIASVSVKRGDEKSYTLVAQEADGITRWSLKDMGVLPDNFRFDAKAAAGLVTSITSLRVREFIEQVPEADMSGLGERAVEILIQPQAEGASPLVLKLGAQKDEQSIFASLSTGDVFTLSTHTSLNLRRKVEDFRALELLSLTPENVVKVAVRDGKRHLSLTKKQQLWEIEKSSEPVPEGFEVDSAAVGAQLRLWGRLKADVFMGDIAKKTGLLRARSWVRLTDSEGKVVELSLGRLTERDGQQLSYVKGNIDEYVYGLMDTTRDQVLMPLSAIRKRTQMMPEGLGSIDPQALKNLPPEIREQIMQQLLQQQRQQALMQQIQGQRGVNP